VPVSPLFAIDLNVFSLHNHLQVGCCLSVSLSSLCHSVSTINIVVLIIIIIIIIKCKGLGTCYSAAYMSQTGDRQRFTIFEVAADWHEPMVPQRIVAIHCPRKRTIGPTVQLADTPSHQSATLGPHPIAVATIPTHFPSRSGHLLCPEHTVG